VIDACRRRQGQARVPQALARQQNRRDEHGPVHRVRRKPSQRQASSLSRRAFLRCTGAPVTALFAPGTATSAAAQTAPQRLQVLHWWTSASERRAVEVLAARAKEKGLSWIDAVVPGGAGVGAGKVLRSRVLAGDTPDATQLIGTTLTDWAETGLLLELDDVANAGLWSRTLFPTVLRHIVHRGHVVAAPIGIHRVNMMFTNRRVLHRVGLPPPATWKEWSALAGALRQQGIAPLALSSEPWQVATLFESLVLASGGIELHHALFVKNEAPAAADARLAEALRRLREIKSWQPAKIEERSWTDALGAMMRGDAAMFAMGDWAKGDLMAAGWRAGEHFDCRPVPGTEGFHLYSIDTLAMLANDYAKSPLQERLAALLVEQRTQNDYNLVKGSVPVLNGLDVAALDPCARDSWLLFARGSAVQAPSLVHRMATEEGIKDALTLEVHRFFVNDSISPADVQRRMGSMFKVLQRQGDGSR
jgi:glucose/mannose transport system substrate-binding protein